MQMLPTIDLTRTDASPQVLAAEAKLLDKACRRVGMFEVVGHQIPQAFCDEMIEVTREFFALPIAEKALVAQPNPDEVRGWTSFGMESAAFSLDEESPADLKEKMDIGPPARSGAAGFHDPKVSGPHFAPNLWPERPAALRGVWEEYFAHMERVCDQLMRLTAVAWGLPSDWFEDKVDKSISMLRGLFFPNQVEAPLSGQFREGVHTDFGAYTVVIAEDRPGGLELLDRAGEWRPISTSQGRLRVHLGDLFPEWTADEWPATLHRVVNPPRRLALESSRVAIAFYQEPNHDTPIEILPPFRVGRETNSEPLFTAGDHLRNKYLLQTTFGRRAPWTERTPH